MKELIIGGVRSGKSRLAEARAHASGLNVTYIATARDSGDEELRARILAHRGRRPAQWNLIEEPIALADTLRHHCAPGTLIVVECLTLWLTNLLCAESSAALEQERESLVEWLPRLPGDVVLVGNETGLGIVPLGALTRRFVDEAGSLHQRLAQRCDRVTLVAAGLPLQLK